jgi:6-phosphofructokinase 2
LETIRSLHPEPDYLVISGSLPEGVPDDFYARLAHIAKKRHIKIILDSSGEPLRRAIKEGVFLIKPNMREVSHLVGQKVEQEAELKLAMQNLIQNGKINTAVISLGAGGVFMINSDNWKHLRAPTVQIRSKVGAGDSTVAGIVLSLAQGRQMNEAVQFGVAAGAAAVMTPGSELCRIEDAENLYRIMINQ